ncbi:MAG: hypothetical protein LBF39_02690 [Prevotellaceae bacterium]|jgi:hypothetical protein|nr:hypothetical protein [Prevotellaceae bacterium]
MKKFYLIVAAIICSSALFAQDIITLKSGDEIKAKVQEIGLDNVKYKKYENQAGPTYTLMQSDIFMIKYENGDKDVFKDAPSDVSTNTVITQPTDHLTFSSGFWKGTIITDGTGKKLNKKEFRSIVSEVPDALAYYNAGLSLHRTSSILDGIGLGLLGASLVDILWTAALADDDTNGGAVSSTWWYWDIAAAGCFTAALICAFSGDANWETAVNLYNSAKSNPHASRTSLNFGLTRSGGIGLTLTF